MGREARANTERRAAIDAIVRRVTGVAADNGRIIEIGFAGMVHAFYPGWAAMPKDQLDALRTAFFGGAQHLFGSIMSMLDPGSEPTKRDLRRFNMIHHELEAFVEAFKQRHGITDPDIGPEQQPKQ